MGKKTIKFTNKKTGTSVEIMSGALGSHVYDVTKSVKDVNASVRWCNNNVAGAKLDCDAFSIEIIGIV